MFKGHIYEKHSNIHQNLKINTSIHHNSTISQSFTKLSTTTTILITYFVIMNIQCINSSTTHPKTTTTTYNHEIIHNSTTTTSFFKNFTQKQNILIYIHSGIQIPHQQYNYHSIHIHEHIIKT